MVQSGMVVLSCEWWLWDVQVHDRMTEQVYLEPLKSFTSPVTPSPVFTVPVLEQGRRALEEINEELGLAFDEQVRHLSVVVTPSHWQLRMQNQSIVRHTTKLGADHCISRCPAR